LKTEHLLKLIERAAYLNNDKEGQKFLKIYFKDQQIEQNANQSQIHGENNNNSAPKTKSLFAKIKSKLKQ